MRSRRALVDGDVTLVGLYRSRGTVNVLLGDREAGERDRREAERLESEENSEAIGGVGAIPP